VTAAEQAYKSRLIKMAWDRYKSDTSHLKVQDPNYRAHERKAWNTLQSTLRSIR
jgi:hypothetical protein